MASACSDGRHCGLGWNWIAPLAPSLHRKWNSAAKGQNTAWPAGAPFKAGITDCWARGCREEQNVGAAAPSEHQLVGTDWGGQRWLPPWGSTQTLREASHRHWLSAMCACGLKINSNLFNNWIDCTHPGVQRNVIKPGLWLALSNQRLEPRKGTSMTKHFFSPLRERRGEI